MHRFFGTLVSAVIIVTMVGAGIAIAAEMEIISSPTESGDHDLTIDVWDFDPDTPVYVLPCEVPESGDKGDVSTDSCDISEVVATTTDAEGKATFSVTWPIPEDGMGVFVGDEQGDHQATDLITGDSSSAASDADDPAVEVLGTNVVQEDLAQTGPRDTILLLLIAAALLAFGAASSTAAHRLDPNRIAV